MCGPLLFGTLSRILQAVFAIFLSLAQNCQGLHHTKLPGAPGKGQGLS